MEVRLHSCESYDPETCRTALQAVVGDLTWVKPGMKIAIKANLVDAADPRKAATTHPVLLAELTKLLMERGASVVVGDSPGGLYTVPVLERVYRICGLQAVEAAGGQLNRDMSVKEGRFPEAAELRSFSYTGWLDSCDAVINFCKLKTHGMMVMTGAVKNFFGTIPGTMKPEYHFRFPDPMRFASMLVDLQLYWKPVLHLVDAVEAMEGNGPTAGTPRHMGLVLACEDSFALDQVCAGLMGIEPETVPTQKAAMDRGLVPSYTVASNWEDFRQEMKLPPGKSMLFRNVLPGKAGELLGKTIEALISPRPELTGDACIGCEKCKAICPAKAISMIDRKPKINRRQCIRCFCCQEFCPKGALASQRPWIAKVLTH